MARNQYFDPFGAYTGGIQAGVRDGMALERGVRDARVMDYDYNTLQPIRTQGLQREENFNQYFDPMRRQISQYGTDRAKFATGRDAIDYAKIPFQLTGNAQPAVTALEQYYGISGVPAGDGFGMDWLDTQAPESPTSGMPGSYAPNYMQDFQDFYFRPEALQQLELQRQQQLDEISRMNAETQRGYLLRQLYNINNGQSVTDDSWIE